jgi:hypothetical protein
MTGTMSVTPFRRLGAGFRLAGVHRGETGERWTVLNTTLVHALAHLVAVLATREGDLHGEQGRLP